MRAERLWIHHTEEIQDQLTGTSLCMTGVVFSLFFRRAKASAKQARARRTRRPQSRVSDPPRSLRACLRSPEKCENNYASFNMQF